MNGIPELEKHTIGSLPTLFYIPDFVTDSEQIQLLNNIHGAPLAKWKNMKNRRLQNWGGLVHEKGLVYQDLPLWLHNITNRICEQSDLYPSAINHVLINEYQPDQGIMPHQDGPAYFPVVAILSLGSPAVMDFTPHSRLRMCRKSSSNEMDVSSDGATFETKTDTWMENHCPFSVLLMPGSLLIFKDEAYTDYLHGINASRVQQLNEVINVNAASECDGVNRPLFFSEHAGEETYGGEEVKHICRTAARVSLTCRLVLKVHKNLFKI